MSIWYMKSSTAVLVRTNTCTFIFLFFKFDKNSTKFRQLYIFPQKLMQYLLWMGNPKSRF